MEEQKKVLDDMKSIKDFDYMQRSKQTKITEKHQPNEQKS